MRPARLTPAIVGLTVVVSGCSPTASAPDNQATADARVQATVTAIQGGPPTAAAVAATANTTAASSQSPPGAASSAAATQAAGLVVVPIHQTERFTAIANGQEYPYDTDAATVLEGPPQRELPITETVDTDPNRLLGTAADDSSRSSFRDARLPQCGLTQESALTAISILGTEYLIQRGKLLLTVSGSLAPHAAAQYQDALLEILTQPLVPPRRRPSAVLPQALKVEREVSGMQLPQPTRNSRRSVAELTSRIWRCRVQPSETAHPAVRSKESVVVRVRSTRMKEASP